MSANSEITPSAFFLARESTLSVNDAVELVALMHKNHSQPKISPIDSFYKFVSGISDFINDRITTAWSERMEGAKSALALVIPIIKQEFNDEMRLRAFTALLATTFATSKSNTLDYFRKHSLEIMNSNRSPFVLSETGKTIASHFLSAVMMFWISYDQMDIEYETRSIAREALNTVSTEFATNDSLFLTWMKEVTAAKFNANISTIMTEGALAKIEIVDGVETVVTQFTTQGSFA